MGLKVPSGRTLGILAGVLAVAALAFVLGVLVTGDAGLPGFDGSQRADRTEAGMTAPEEAPVASDELGARQYSGEDASAEKDATAGADRMIIRNEGLELRVERVERAVDDVREAARRFEADITNLQVVAGEDSGPIPLYERSADRAYPSPSRAYITLRVPAEKLDALRTEVSRAGTVLSQTSSSDDVGQVHADLSARLKNLKAQEARLRALFDRATEVSDLLAIEQELARVRGEIESLQAQIDFLDRQVARATLTLTLTERGPVVRPDSGDWGFVEAITRGIQAAAALVGLLITGLIAIAPLAIVAAIAWWVVRAIRRRRAAKTGDAERSNSEPSQTTAGEK
jgi:hypothetical protein